MRFAVVIPAHNEAATIRDVVQRVLAQSQHVIVVDDGSTDDTASVLAGLPITLLRNPTNQGKGAALWRGMQHALGEDVEGVVSIDADGQHAPEDIPRLIAAVEANAGRIVIGARIRNTQSAPWYRLFANKFANFWLSWACGYRITDSQSGFRYYPADFLRRIFVPHDRSRGFVFESEILVRAARVGVRSIAIPIASVYLEGQRPSHYRQIDTWRITRMVALSLLSRGLYLQGLFRALVIRERI